jgi:catechol 2,3-dioxygenase-like lactoylglutathione lyase family enzyme
MDKAMVKTYGLTHIALSVRDLDKTLRFYTHVFGVEEYSRAEASCMFELRGLGT